MAAYVITDVEITDLELFAEFRERLDPTVAAHGGTFIVRGENITVVQGDWNPRRIAMIEFPNLEAANSWLHSSEFGAIRALLDKSSNTNLVIVDGI